MYDAARTDAGGDEKLEQIDAARLGFGCLQSTFAQSTAGTDDRGNGVRHTDIVRCQLSLDWLVVLAIGLEPLESSP